MWAKTDLVSHGVVLRGEKQTVSHTYINVTQQDPREPPQYRPLPNTCFSSSLKYLDNNIGITFPESVYRCSVQFSSVQFNRSVLSSSLRPHGLQYARLPCPSTPRDCSNFLNGLKSISSSVLNFLYGPTLTSIHDYWRNQSFD